MTDINIDDFFKDAARTLAALYGVFPRRHAIFVDDIYQTEEPDEFGLHSERYQACFGTLLWLGEEGKGAATLMAAPPDDVLSFYRVDPKVNSNRASGEDLIEPI